MHSLKDESRTRRPLRPYGPKHNGRVSESAVGRILPASAKGFRRSGPRQSARWGAPWKHLKATVDVGNYMTCGQEGAVGTRLAAPFAAYVHFKDMKKVADAAAPAGWKINACVLGEGDVDHRACLDILKKAGYNGFVALEYQGPEDEKTGVPRSVAFMKKVMKGF